MCCECQKSIELAVRDGLGVQIGNECHDNKGGKGPHTWVDVVWVSVSKLRNARTCAEVQCFLWRKLEYVFLGEMLATDLVQLGA